MVVTLPTSADFDGMRAVGHAVAATIDAMSCRLEPGITTAELDDIGRAALESSGARPAPELVYSFPGATCISVNDEAAHGIPGPRAIAQGDLVNIDVSAELGGYYADSGSSFGVGDIGPERAALLAAAREALDQAFERVRPGERINEVGRAIARTARRRGFRVIRNLCGHGVGRSLHEDPRAILNYYDPNDRRSFVEGQVLTIEPFLSDTADHALQAGDGWTLRTSDGGLAVQYEHTIVVTPDGPLVLTAL